VQQKTEKVFIEQAHIIHGGLFDYSLVNYKNSHIPVTIICRKHGPFLQKPYQHLAGYGCKYCKADNQRLSTQTFIDRCNLLYDNKYDYSLVEYIHNKQKVQIICPQHGHFLRKPNDHLYGVGCPNCKTYNKSGKDIFIQKAINTHGDMYDYSLVEYINSKTPVNIICKKHGVFSQVPDTHINARCGCRKCSRVASKSEQEWLDYVGVPDKPETRQVHKQLGKKHVFFDGFIPETNTVYEFYGDMWHGNLDVLNPADVPFSFLSKTAEQLWNETQLREQLIKQYGYNLVTIWGSEWSKIKQEMKNGKV
jgi:glutaredoxin